MCMIGNYANSQTVGIIGYRAWKLGRRGNVPVLVSTAHKGFRYSRLTHADAPPDQFNNRGLWTYKTMEKVKGEFRSSQFGRFVYGKVRLSGVVAEHSDGYRGEAAEILAIECPSAKAFKTIGTYRYHRGRLRRIARECGIKLTEA